MSSRINNLVAACGILVFLLTLTIPAHEGHREASGSEPLIPTTQPTPSPEPSPEPLPSIGSTSCVIIIPPSSVDTLLMPSGAQGGVFGPGKQPAGQPSGALSKLIKIPNSGVLVMGGGQTAPLADKSTAKSNPPSTSSSPAGAGQSWLAHIYNKEQATQLAAKGNVPMVVIGHGVGEMGDAYTGILKYIEYVPVYVSKKHALGNLTQRQLVKILKGEIDDWEQLGEDKGRITIYLHGAELQRKLFIKLLETINLSAGDLKNANLKYIDNYETLESAASKDSNALVIGLRNLQPVDLKLVAIDCNSIVNLKNLEQYPLRVPIYIFRKNTAQSLAYFNYVIAAIDRNNPLQSATPRPRPRARRAPPSEKRCGFPHKVKIPSRESKDLQTLLAHKMRVLSCINCKNPAVSVQIVKFPAGANAKRERSFIILAVC